MAKNYVDSDWGATNIRSGAYQGGKEYKAGKQSATDLEIGPEYRKKWKERQYADDAKNGVLNIRADIDTALKQGEEDYITESRAKKPEYKDADTAKTKRSLKPFNMAKGGSVSSASKRADGCAVKGKTKGRMV